MKTAKEIFGNETYFSSYGPMLDEFGQILLQVDDGDYQGDSRVMYYKGGQFGYLIFGWGSCSGCDRLQGCSDIVEVQNLMDELDNDIQWFASLDEIKHHFKTKDWELDHAWHAEETKDFIEQVLAYEPPDATIEQLEGYLRKEGEIIG